MYEWRLSFLVRQASSFILRCPCFQSWLVLVQVVVLVSVQKLNILVPLEFKIVQVAVKKEETQLENQDILNIALEQKL